MSPMCVFRDPRGLELLAGLLEVLGQQLPDTAKDGCLLFQESDDISEEKLSYGFGHQLQGQRIAGVTLK